MIKCLLEKDPKVPLIDHTVSISAYSPEKGRKSSRIINMKYNHKFTGRILGRFFQDNSLEKPMIERMLENRIHQKKIIKELQMQAELKEYLEKK